MTTEMPIEDPAAQPTQDAAAVPAAEPTAEPTTGAAPAGPVFQELSDLPAAEAAAISAAAVDTTIIRAPKLGAFLWFGGLVGVVLGLILGFWMSAPNLINRWIFITLTVVFVTLVAGLIAAGLYVYLDKRARAKAHA